MVQRGDAGAIRGRRRCRGQGGSTPSQLAFFDAAMRFVVEPGQFQVMRGASTADLVPTAVEVE